MSSAQTPIDATGSVMVVGSANMDTVFAVDRIPQPGETLLAESATRHPGGKGLNQAVAAARAGAHTLFVGALGQDPFGAVLADTLSANGIDASLVRHSTRDTGQAFIMVDRQAENMIVVASGANATVLELDDAEAAAIESCAVLLMQLELPLTTVRQAAARAHASGRSVILNAAPAAPLDDELADLLDYLIVNEHEACVISGNDDVGIASLALATRVRVLIVTLGSEGSAVYERGKFVGHVLTPRVRAVDTTGAGDTFCGAFAAAIAEKQSLLSACAFATAAAALSVQTLGAVPSVPTRPAIDRFLIDGFQRDGS